MKCMIQCWRGTGEKRPYANVFSNPCFPVFGLNKGKYGPEKNCIQTLFAALATLKNFSVSSFFAKKEIFKIIYYFLAASKLNKIYKFNKKKATVSRSNLHNYSI